MTELVRTGGGTLTGAERRPFSPSGDSDGRVGGEGRSAGYGGEADAPIRAITLTAQNLIPEDEATEQLGLFAPEEPHRRDKAEKLERVVDRLRERYGHDAVTPSFRPSPA